MTKLSKTSAIISLITFLQNIGSVLDFKKFIVSPKVQKICGFFKNLISVIADNTLGLIKNTDFNFMISFIIFLFSILIFSSSFVHGLETNNDLINTITCLLTALPLFFLIYFQVNYYFQILGAIVSPIIFFSI